MDGHQLLYSALLLSVPPDLPLVVWELPDTVIGHCISWQIALTNNRSISEVKHAYSKHGQSLRLHLVCTNAL